MEHENRPLPPADHDLGAFLDLVTIEIDRAAGRQRRGVGVHLVDQRRQRRGGADRADGGGCDIEKIAPRGFGGVAAVCRRRRGARHGRSSAVDDRDPVQLMP